MKITMANGVVLNALLGAVSYNMTPIRISSRHSAHSYRRLCIFSIYF